MISNGGFRFSNRLERKILQRTGAAIGEYQLITEGDHIMVAVSGGKDSLSLLEILMLLQRRSPISFTFTAVTVHKSEVSGLPPELVQLEAYYRDKNYNYQILHVPIDQILKEKLEPGVIPCSLCSRIRRGALYTLAPQLGCNKIALGHHLDDLIETLLLNLFYGGKLRSMAPLLISDDGRNKVIRPFCFVPESWLATYSQIMNFPVSTCTELGCSHENSRRQQMKKLITDMAKHSPGIRWHVLRALRNIHPEHLLDKKLLKQFQITNLLGD